MTEMNGTRRGWRGWLIGVGVVLTILLAFALRSRAAATGIVRAGSVNFTQHVSTRLCLSCDARHDIHWHVTFAVPQARLAGGFGPSSVEATSYVSWSETWNKKDAIAKRSQTLIYR
jgi:hypothetical protein